MPVRCVRHHVETERTLNHTCLQASERLREVVGRVAASGERSGRPTTSREKATCLTPSFSKKHNTVAPFLKGLLCSLIEKR